MQLGLVVLGVSLSVGMMVQREAHADTAQPAPAQSLPTIRSEGRIAVARAINGGTFASSADAEFTNSPVWGQVVATDGPCTLRLRRRTAGLSAGTITITGTASPITLVERRDAGGIRYKPTGPVPNPSYVDEAQITVESSGGSDLPAFTGTVTAPRQLAGYSPPTSLSRTGYTATWTAVAGSKIMIVIAPVTTRREGVAVVCRVPDTGALRVPASTFSLIPQLYDRAIVIVARIAESVQILGDAQVMIDVVSSVMSGPFPLTVVEPQQPQGPRETSPRLFLGVGFGRDEGNAHAWRIQLGRRLAHGLHLVEDLNWIRSADILEGHRSVGVGIRWTPFEPRLHASPFPLAPLAPFVDIRSFYFTAVVGADLRDRVMQTTLTESTVDYGWSPMASLAVGLLGIQGHDWALGPEFRGQLTRFDRKLQRDWQLMLAVHLNQW
jgi:hypothetical protein